MPWNNGGPGPWGNPSGSSGGDDDKKPTQAPGATRAANKGGGDGELRIRIAAHGRPGRGPGGRPGGPFGGGGGPFGGGPFGGGGPPDLDRLIAQAQAYIRGMMGGGSGGGRRRPVRRLRQRPRPDPPAAGGRRAVGRQRLLPGAAR